SRHLLRPEHWRRAVGLMATVQDCRLEHRRLLRAEPEQTQVARRLPGQFHLALLDPLIGKTRARHLPLPPAAPLLQVVAGLDAEALKALLGATPAQLQAHQG